MAESSVNSKPGIYEWKILFWAFTPAKVVIYQYEWFSGLFDARPEIFPSRNILK